MKSLPLQIQQVDVRQRSAGVVWHCNKRREMAEKLITKRNHCKEGWGSFGECIIQSMFKPAFNKGQRESIEITRQAQLRGSYLHVPRILLSVSAEFQIKDGNGSRVQPELCRICPEDPRAKANPWYRADMRSPPPDNETSKPFFPPTDAKGDLRVGWPSRPRLQIINPEASSTAQINNPTSKLPRCYNKLADCNGTSQADGGGNAAK